MQSKLILRKLMDDARPLAKQTRGPINWADGYTNSIVRQQQAAIQRSVDSFGKKLEELPPKQQKALRKFGRKLWDRSNRQIDQKIASQEKELSAQQGMLSSNQIEQIKDKAYDFKTCLEGQLLERTFRKTSSD